MKQPYDFIGPYADCYANVDMAMDPRHVFILHEILRGWPFKNALELGSFRGASSTAFIEAINAGSEMVATFCDINLTESLDRVMSSSRNPDRVRFTQEPSWNVLECSEVFDFVLVDAGHTIEAVTPEMERLLIRRPLCVMGHDTSATDGGYKHAEGAAMLKRTFQSLPEYHCIEDAKYREGEQTHRGLFLATTDLQLYDVAKSAFEKWG